MCDGINISFCRVIKQRITPKVSSLEGVLLKHPLSSEAYALGQFLSQHVTWSCHLDHSQSFIGFKLEGLFISIEIISGSRKGIVIQCIIEVKVMRTNLE